MKNYINKRFPSVVITTILGIKKLFKIINNFVLTKIQC